MELISENTNLTTTTIDLSTIPTWYWVLIAVFAILNIIAMWKIFEKAGEEGWKAIIPIYNSYVLCKIIKINFWIWILLVPFVLGFIGGLVPALVILTTLYIFVIYIYIDVRLGKVFGKSTGFIIGLILLAPIFYLILAFDDSTYIG